MMRNQTGNDALAGQDTLVLSERPKNGEQQFTVRDGVHLLGKAVEGDAVLLEVGGDGQ
jgi:hypothetical protein